jgi:hypothetical protein
LVEVTQHLSMAAETNEALHLDRQPSLLRLVQVAG